MKTDQIYNQIELELNMACVLAEFRLPVDLNNFITLFWSDQEWYRKFLVLQLEDLSVDVGEWTPHGTTGVVRQISSMHPSKMSFPGMRLEI